MNLFALAALVASLVLSFPAVSDVPRSSGVMTVRGKPAPYLAEGQGETCIVVGLAPNYAQLFSSQLKQSFRLIYVDYRSSWGADPDTKVDAITLDTLVEEVDDVRRALGQERACLIGHSLEGLLAVEYVARHPERTSRVILITVPPSYGKELLDARKAFWDEDASPARKAALTENQRRIPDSVLDALDPRDSFALRYVRNGPKYFYDASWDFYWAFSGRRYSSTMLDRWFNVILPGYDPWQRLAANKVPIFVAQGRYNYAIPYRLWDPLRTGVPGLTYTLFERSGHFPMLEEQAAFDRAVMRWQARTRTEASGQR